jgi:hypothetical protein
MQLVVLVAVASEMLFMPADTPEGDLKLVLPRTQDVEYRWALTVC